MIKINYKKSLAFILPSLFFIPLFIFAGSSGFTIENPLGKKNTDVKAILALIMNIVELVGGIVVAFFIIFSGFKFVMAKGNPGELEKAKEMFYATVIGAAILLGAGIIAEVVVNTVETIKK
jgi:hypothetical protein